MRSVFWSATVSLLVLTGCSQSTLMPGGLVPTDFEEAPPTEQTQDTPPPADEPPADQPPADQPPADEPPADEPPADEPPADEPPADEPPADEPPADEPPADEPPPPPLDCGPNAAEIAGSCECDAVYTVCDAADQSMGCCAYGIDTFEVTIVSATILPFEDPVDESPWDWSGFVPGWMQDLIGTVVVYFSEDADEWVDMIDYVIDFAPELLEGTTPPDPLVIVEIDDNEVFQTSTQDDTIEPHWNQFQTFTVNSTAQFTLRFMDEDFDFDDHIGGVYFTQEQLQWFSGLGALTFDGAGGVNDFTVMIEPVD